VKKATLNLSFSPPQLKSIAAVLLRRIFLHLEYKDIQKDIKPDLFQASRAELLVSLQGEMPGHVRRKICDAIAEVARSCLGELSLMLPWLLHMLCR